jgi:hypothetical protein
MVQACERGRRALYVQLKAVKDLKDKEESDMWTVVCSIN